MKEQKEREVESLRKLLSHHDDVVAKQGSEMAELNSTIRRMDANALQQRQEYDQVPTFASLYVKFSCHCDFVDCDGDDCDCDCDHDRDRVL